MPVDAGALNGLAQGLKEGLGGYLEAKEKSDTIARAEAKRKEDMARDDHFRRVDLETRGYSEDPVSGRVMRTPEYLAEEKRKLDNAAEIAKKHHEYEMESKTVDRNAQQKNAIELEGIKFGQNRQLRASDNQAALTKEMVNQGYATPDAKGKIVYNQGGGMIGKQIEKLAKQNEAVEKLLPSESQAELDGIKTSNKALSMAHSGLSQLLKQLQDPGISEDQKRQIGKDSAKLLNSTEGKDAIGAEESKRMLSLLEYQMGNFTNSRAPLIGFAPTSEFASDVALNLKRIEGRIKDNADKTAKLKAPIAHLVPEIPQSLPSKQGGILPKATASAALPTVDDINAELARRGIK